MFLQRFNLEYRGIWESLQESSELIGSNFLQNTASCGLGCMQTAPGDSVGAIPPGSNNEFIVPPFQIAECLESAQDHFVSDKSLTGRYWFDMKGLHFRP